MFHNKVRLAIPTGMLIVGSGTIPALNKLSFPDLIFRGGDVNFLKKQLDSNSKIQNLVLDNHRIKHLESKGYPKNVTSELEVKEEDLIEPKVFPNELDTYTSLESVKVIFSEVKKEDKVITINGKSQSKVKSTQSKLKPSDRSQFRLALDKIKNFDKESSGVSPRSLKPTSSTPRVSKLSESEKDSISNFFEQFDSLNTGKEEFSVELSNAIGDSRSDRSDRKVCVSCISKDLKKIGWANKEMNIFEKSPSYRHHPSLPYIYYQNNVALELSKAQSTWGDWDNTNHPYRNLFTTEDEWNRSVQKISDYWKAYYGTMNSKGRIFCSLATIGALCKGGKGKLEQGIHDAKAYFELKIGTRLMNLMERL